METTTTPSTARVALKYGLFVGLGLVILYLIIQLAGLGANTSAGSINAVLSFVILIIGIVYAIKEFRGLKDGYMSYGQGLGLGSLTSAVAGLISGIFTSIYVGFIDDSSLKQAMDQARLDLEEKGMDDAQIDQAIEVASRFQTPGFLLAYSVIMMLIVGFILSLIIAAIMKKERNELQVW